MDLVSLCPLPAAVLAWQPGPGRWALTVVCKATYRLEPGTSPLAGEQEPVSDRDNHWDDDPNRSLYAPGDLVPFKPRADVVLVGSAHARNGQLVRSLVVRMILGAVDKSIEVVCPRVRTRDGELREGKRWSSMPLRYERAAGGPDSDNPVGMAHDGPRDLYGQVQLPNLQPPGLHVTGDEVIEPIGFGPIAESWQARRRKAPGGDHDWHRAPFGEGFDPSYFQVAPLDQQTEAIRPNERIVLENLHPKHQRLVTSLPDIAPRALVEPLGAPSRELALAADTLWIDTHRAICTVTFRGHFDLESLKQEGRILLAMGKSQEKTSWAKIAPPLPAPRPPPAPPSQPAPPAVEIRDALPTMEIAAPTTEDLPGPSEPSSPEIDVAELMESIEITQADSSSRVLLGEGGKPLLPFQAPPPEWKPPPAAVTFGPPPRATTGGKSAEVSTQKLDMTTFRAALPVWLEPGSPPPLQPSAVVPPVAPTPPRPAPVPSPPVLLAAPPPEGSFSVLTASNAAASVGDRPATRPAAVEPREGSQSASSAVVIELIWFDPAAGSRLAAHPSFSAWKPAAEPPTEEALRAHVHEVLSKGAPASLGDLESILSAAEEESPPSTPLVLAGGELTLCFDETEVLKAVVSAAAPLAGSDKKLKEAVDLAVEMLKTPLQGMPEIAEGLSARIREAWSKVNRALPPSYIAVATERLLLEQRQYQRRELLDDTWIRALLGAGAEALPVYLPAKIARRLPLYKRFPARLLAEVIWQQDQYESQPIALRALGLGRVSTRARARSVKKR